ncbi:MAG TPA: AraC family transcriptional regulator [Lachnospiraceae bacterium]|nr:AraC family transcriptional regulator [Lachnospiraceae bacterium]
MLSNQDMHSNQDVISNTKYRISDQLDVADVNQIAFQMGYSAKQLNRIFSRRLGITVGEYIRYKRLAEAVIQLRYSKRSILDIALSCGYESQESFTRAFSSLFDITPNRYRKNRKVDQGKIEKRLIDIIEETSHEEAHNGILSTAPVSSWIISKPSRLWLSACRNERGLFPHDFYVQCEKEGLYEKIQIVEDAVTVGGAYLTHRYLGRKFDSLTLGAEVSEDYDVSHLNGFDVTYIPASSYVVFNTPPYACEELGSSVKATWNAFSEFDYTGHSLFRDMDHAPIFEEDSKELGYTLTVPVRKL